MHVLYLLANLSLRLHGTREQMDGGGGQTDGQKQGCVSGIFQPNLRGEPHGWAFITSGLHPGQPRGTHWRRRPLSGEALPHPLVRETDPAPPRPPRPGPAGSSTTAPRGMRNPPKVHALPHQGWDPQTLQPETLCVCLYPSSMRVPTPVLYIL